MPRSTWPCACPLSGLGLLLASCNLVPAGQAQLADVARPDAQGRFPTSRIAGHRGSYLQRQWLVIDRSGLGLPCRNPAGVEVVRLAYGAVVDSAPRSESHDAVEWIGHQAWLWVRVDPVDVLRFSGGQVPRTVALRCRLRAEADHIAPLNPDTLNPTTPRPILPSPIHE